MPGRTLTLKDTLTKYSLMIKTQILLFSLIAFSCSHAGKDSQTMINGELNQGEPKDSVITLKSFLHENELLDHKVDSVFATMSDGDKVAQLIMPAIGPYGQEKSTIDKLISEGKIGGLLMLNGSKDQFTSWISEFEHTNDSLGKLPFLYSADAEPSLVNRKIKGSTIVKKAIDINTVEEASTSAKMISKDLNDIGINYNFAPVVDVSKNSTVGYRGFGKDPKNIIPFSNAFIEETQSSNIIATAKHFPGHGLVSGDTHKALQVIDGELQELHNYPPLIENGVLSIMVAHIAVQNNDEFDTKGMPATTSKKIVTELLRDSLGFEGLIVTDAMNMGGVAKVENAEVLAVKAGCDIVLMPLNAMKAHERLLKEYQSNEESKKGIDNSVKRIIRMKICLGLIK